MAHRAAGYADAVLPRVRLEDWILAAIFGLFPLLGLALSTGNAVSLAGVGVLVWTAHRAAVTSDTREAFRRTGIVGLLVLLCLILPGLEGLGDQALFPGKTFAWAVRLALCTVLLLGLLRGQLLWRGWMRGTDAAIGISLLLSAGLMVGLWRAGEVTALQSLAQTVLSLTLVFGIYRVHLVRSAALPLLARSAVIGVLGAAFVAALHA